MLLTFSESPAFSQTESIHFQRKDISSRVMKLKLTILPLAFCSSPVLAVAADDSSYDLSTGSILGSGGVGIAYLCGEDVHPIYGGTFEGGVHKYPGLHVSLSPQQVVQATADRRTRSSTSAHPGR